MCFFVVIQAATFVLKDQSLDDEQTLKILIDFNCWLYDSQVDDYEDVGGDDGDDVAATAAATTDTVVRKNYFLINTSAMEQQPQLNEKLEVMELLMKSTTTAAASVYQTYWDSTNYNY